MPRMARTLSEVPSDRQATTTDLRLWTVDAPVGHPGAVPRHDRSPGANSDGPARPAAMTGGTQDMADERGRIFIEPAQYTDLDRWHAVATEMRAEGPLHRV